MVVYLLVARTRLRSLICPPPPRVTLKFSPLQLRCAAERGSASSADRESLRGAPSKCDAAACAVRGIASVARRREEAQRSDSCFHGCCFVSVGFDAQAARVVGPERPALASRLPRTKGDTETRTQIRVQRQKLRNCPWTAPELVWLVVSKARRWEVAAQYGLYAPRGLHKEQVSPPLYLYSSTVSYQFSLCPNVHLH